QVGPHRPLSLPHAPQPLLEWDLAEGASQVLRLSSSYNPELSWGAPLAVHPDGNTFAVGKGYTLSLWDGVAGVRRASWSGRAAMTACASGPAGRAGGVSPGRRVGVWAPAGGPGGKSWDGRAQPFQAVAWAPDGSRLAVGRLLVVPSSPAPAEVAEIPDP